MLRLEFWGFGLSPAAPMPWSNKLISSVVEFPVGSGVAEGVAVDGSFIIIVAEVVAERTFSLACSLGPAERT